MDIDTDFETERRDEVIEYVLQRYPGHAAQIASYGMYKVDNLINDLAKVCGLPTDKTVDPEIKKANVLEIRAIKKLVKTFDSDGAIDIPGLQKSPEYDEYNAEYDNILLHFTNLYNKVKYMGTHAAGVALTREPIINYTALRVKKTKGSDEVKYFTAYDLNDFEAMNVIKFDMLGLKTMGILGELRRMTKHNGFDEKVIKDKKVLRAFRNGETTGVFQMEKEAARKMLEQVHCDCFDDLIAVNAMNRPGPLQLKMPDQYADNKKHVESVKDTLVYPYTKESYGTIIYQEQLQQICINIGGLPWSAADKIMKTDRTGTAADIRRYHECFDTYHDDFMENAIKNGMPEDEAAELFDSLFNYQFNKGHATGYSLISMEEMYYKVYYPFQYWLVKLKYEPDARRRAMFESEYVRSGRILLPPDMNAKAHYSVRTYEGEKCIQQGLTSIKGIGIKAALNIEQNRPYEDRPDFEDKVDHRIVNKRVFHEMEVTGCFVTNKKARFHKILYLNKLMYGKHIKA